MTTKSDTPNYYKIALNRAQTHMVKSCRPDREKLDYISTQNQYTKNWTGYKHYIDIPDDKIVINENNKNYTFSKSQFLSNKRFQYLVINDYKNLLGNIFVKFIKKQDDKYIIMINQLHNS